MPPPDADDRSPVRATGFAASMAKSGPWEPRPRLAVAVSGGADSMALCLLADGWARRRRGRVLALVVDHRLRPGSGAEAKQAVAWLAARDIEAAILRPPVAPAAGASQAAARDLRYGLLIARCDCEGILHLLLGHHRDDQAETFLLRLGRGSGPDGLAAMAAVSERADVRLLRPLLSLPRSRLRATLRARRQPWLDDPSNENTSYARVRIRRALPELAAAIGAAGETRALTVTRLAETATRMGHARTALDIAVAGLLAAAARPAPGGWLWLDRAALAAAPEAVAMRALARALATVGGGLRGPRAARLERLWQALRTGPARPATLAGCRILPDDSGRLLICREPGAMAPPLLPAGPAAKAALALWDGRFRLSGRAGPGPALSLGALQAGGWRSIAHTLSPATRRGVPAAVRASLPALRDAAGLLAVPDAGWRRAGAEDRRLPSILFAPASPLAAAPWQPPVA